MKLNITLLTEATSGYAWIDEIKLIPVEGSNSIGGTVVISGKDENGNTVYTATAEDGFKVSSISANNYDVFLGAYPPLVFNA
jgi:hypothetical protein